MQKFDDQGGTQVIGRTECSTNKGAPYGDGLLNICFFL
jgi:hypothetical protein